MAKELVAKIKLQVPAGEANPAPPVGPALGQHGVNIGEFVSRFNAATQDKKGVLLPTIINVYSDNTFDFITKEPPAAVLLKQAAGIAKGSGVPNREKVAKITRAQLEEITRAKMPDLNATDPEHAMRIIAGTARSMGIEIED